jgi:hypothetical protein
MKLTVAFGTRSLSASRSERPLSRQLGGNLE